MDLKVTALPDVSDWGNWQAYEAKFKIERTMIDYSRSMVVCHENQNELMSLYSGMTYLCVLFVSSLVAKVGVYF